MFILDAVSKPGRIVYFGRISGICLEGPRRTKRRSLSGLPMFRHICYIAAAAAAAADDNNTVINLTYANIT